VPEEPPPATHTPKAVFITTRDICSSAASMQARSIFRQDQLMGHGTSEVGVARSCGSGLSLWGACPFADSANTATCSCARTRTPELPVVPHQGNLCGAMEDDPSSQSGSVHYPDTDDSYDLLFKVSNYYYKPCSASLLNNYLSAPHSGLCHTPFSGPVSCLSLSKWSPCTGRASVQCHYETASE
jgi:hypothetical protein